VAVDARIKAALEAVGLLTKVVASKEVGSSSKDYKGIVEEVISKKKRLTTIKI
jgi:hypothetical protein